jgi:hypothetical protein
LQVRKRRLTCEGGEEKEEPNIKTEESSFFLSVPDEYFAKVNSISA